MRGKEGVVMKKQGPACVGYLHKKTLFVTKIEVHLLTEDDTGKSVLGLNRQHQSRYGFRDSNSFTKACICPT
jgi:hypothetical protein